METPTRSMSGIEKLRKLVEVKNQVQKEAKERYRNDPGYRAIFERLREENAQRRANQ